MGGEPTMCSDEHSIALCLAKSSMPVESLTVSVGSMVDWASESHAIAAKRHIGTLPYAMGALSASYWAWLCDSSANCSVTVLDLAPR